MKLKLIKIAATGLFVISTTANAEWLVTRIIDNPVTSVSWGNDINDSGMVVGGIQPNSVSYTYDTHGNIAGTAYNGIATRHPFITGVNGTGLKILDIEGEAYGINNIGQIVGSTPRGAFMTGPNGEGITYLDYAVNAFDINNSGQVVGETKNHHAFITGPNGVGMTDLGTLDGDYSLARAVNDSGQVAGWSTSLSGGFLTVHAFITGPNGSGMTDLGAPDGAASYAYDINNSGQVVGNYVFAEPSTGIFTSRPFITDASGSNIRDPNIGNGGAYGINDSGQVVIYSNTMCDMCSPGDGTSLIFDHGTIININNQFLPKEWFGFGAAAINNSGQIAGTGSGTTFPFMWSAAMISFPTGAVSPIPEPQTYAMLLVGLGLLGYATLRRKESAV